MRVEFIKELGGWLLNPPKEIDMCERCGEKLQFPFLWCEEFQKVFCMKCEYETPSRICPSRKKEHSHFKVIDIQKLEE